MKILAAKLSNGITLSNDQGWSEESFRATIEKSQRISQLPAPHFFYIEKSGHSQISSSDTK